VNAIGPTISSGCALRARWVAIGRRHGVQVTGRGSRARAGDGVDIVPVGKIREAGRAGSLVGHGDEARTNRN
jgi:hypothetical protein